MSSDPPPISASSALTSTSLRDSPIAASPLVAMCSASEGLRLGCRELVVGQRAGGMELRKVLDLVSGIRRWWRICRRLLGGRILVRLLLFHVCPVMSDRCACYERPASGPPPESHGSLLVVVRATIGDRQGDIGPPAPV